MIRIFFLRWIFDLTLVVKNKRKIVCHQYSFNLNNLFVLVQCIGITLNYEKKKNDKVKIIKIITLFFITCFFFLFGVGVDALLSLLGRNFQFFFF